MFSDALSSRPSQDQKYGGWSDSLEDTLGTLFNSYQDLYRGNLCQGIRLYIYMYLYTLRIGLSKFDTFYIRKIALAVSCCFLFVSFSSFTLASGALKSIQGSQNTSQAVTSHPRFQNDLQGCQITPSRLNRATSFQITHTHTPWALKITLKSGPSLSNHTRAFTTRPRLQNHLLGFGIILFNNVF